MSDAIRSAVREIVAEYHCGGISEIDNDANLSAIGIDSLDIQEISATVENECGVDIQPCMTERMTSVNKIVEIVEGLL